MVKEVKKLSRPSQGKLIHGGYVWKKGGGSSLLGRRSWKRRYMELWENAERTPSSPMTDLGPSLRYYKKHGANQPCSGKILLFGYNRISCYGRKDKPNHAFFDLVHSKRPNRSFKFTNETDRHKWVDLITIVVKSHLEAMNPKCRAIIEKAIEDKYEDEVDILPGADDDDDNDDDDDDDQDDQDDTPTPEDLVEDTRTCLEINTAKPRQGPADHVQQTAERLMIERKRTKTAEFRARAQLSSSTPIIEDINQTTVKEDFQEEKQLDQNLNELWVAHLDPATDATFYVNSQGESRWEAPPHDALIIHNLPPPWQAHLDPTSKAPFFHNPETGENRWEQPVSFS